VARVTSLQENVKLLKDQVNGVEGKLDKVIEMMGLSLITTLLAFSLRINIHLGRDPPKFWKREQNNKLKNARLTGRQSTGSGNPLSKQK